MAPVWTHQGASDNIAMTSLRTHQGASLQVQNNSNMYVNRFGDIPNWEDIK